LSKVCGSLCGLLGGLLILSSGASLAWGQAELRMLPPPAPESAPPPLEQETDEAVVAEAIEQVPVSPNWYNPWSWVGPRLWDGSMELGINGTSGNAQTFSMRTGANLKRETDRTKMTLDVTYARTEADSVETQNGGFLRSRVDWKLGDSPWALFHRLGLEYDEFKPFDIRLQLSGGLAYDVFDTEFTELTTRFGAGASREIGAADDTWQPEANFGIDLERKLTDRQKLTATVDYFPAWEDFSDYRIVSNAGWEILLSEASNMSMKILVIDQYDSTPQGAEANDIDYALLLLWKL
jgi:putative salt-induced outer membrane protein YdiY